MIHCRVIYYGVGSEEERGLRLGGTTEVLSLVNNCITSTHVHLNHAHGTKTRVKCEQHLVPALSVAPLLHS